MTDTRPNLTLLPKDQQLLALKELQNHVGWQLIREICENGVMALIRRELEEGEQESLAQVNELKYKLSVYKEVFALPVTIEKQIADAVDGGLVEEDDPYEQNIKDQDEPIKK